MLVRLAQLGSAETALSPNTLASVASYLGSVELYVCLAPLETLSKHTDSRVRAAVLRATRKLFFKRSFITVQRGLADPQSEVRREALACVQQLHFAHALDPLSRIYRESADAEVRAAALGTIGKVNRIEAVELLLEALRNGDPRERELAKDMLMKSDQPQARELLRREAADAQGPLRNDLDAMLRAMGG
jgi:HEAT repeat protein